MFITKTKSGCKLCKKQVVNDIGLGQDEQYRETSDNQIDEKYRTENTAGKIYSQVLPMFQPPDPFSMMPLPVSDKVKNVLKAASKVPLMPGMNNVMPAVTIERGKEVETLLSRSMPVNPYVGVAKALTPFAGKLQKEADMAIRAGTALVTFGASEVVRLVAAPLQKIFSGFFKKATHMGDCMKWFNNENNIRGMSGGAQPYPIEQLFSFEDYMMKNFPQFLRQYQILRAGGQWASVGVDAYLNSVRSQINDMSVRRQKIQNIFVRLVRENSQIMELQCAVQHSGESGYTGHTQAQVNEIWDSLKEAARQEEYQVTSRAIENVGAKIDQLVAPFKVKETWGAVVKSRNTNLAIKTEHGSQ